MTRITADMINVDEAATNITRWLDLATDQEHDLGCGWYYHAHEFARTLAYKYGSDLATAAAVISALSPGCHWEQNLIDAAAIFDSGSDATVATYKRNRTKAVNLAAGDLAPDTAFRAATGYKTLQFYRNIASPDLDGPVTIDRHCIRAALGTDLTAQAAIVWIKTPKKYERLQLAYQQAAENAGLKANQCQAIVWLVFRRLHGRAYTINGA